MCRYIDRLATDPSGDFTDVQKHTCTLEGAKEMYAVVAWAQENRIGHLVEDLLRQDLCSLHQIRSNLNASILFGLGPSVWRKQMVVVLGYHHYAESLAIWSPTTGLKAAEVNRLLDAAQQIPSDTELCIWKKPAREWSVADVSSWLVHAIEVPEYAETFSRNLVNGAMLLSLNEHDLQAELNIGRPLHRRRLLIELDHLRVSDVHYAPQDCINRLHHKCV